MGKTFKDTKDYRPVPRAKGKRNPGFTRRGCNLHGVKNCDWCMSNLTFDERKNLEWWDGDQDNNDSESEHESD